MAKQTKGIHHITAIVGDPQENVDFYGGILGLRMVKKTINFDDPGTYHLYFGDDRGNPGTIMTFFPWKGAQHGKIGRGQVGVISFAIPQGARHYWEERLGKFNVSYTKAKRFGEWYVTFEDPHGLQLEMVERIEGNNSQWNFGGVTSEFAIKGFGGATLLSRQPERTSDLLENLMGLEKIGQEEEYLRFKSIGTIGNVIDIKLVSPNDGVMGVGTNHHIAWRAEDDQDQLDWKQLLEEHGYAVTPVQDRNYFNSIYFKEHGEILFEIATDPPGFAHDESQETMGSKLMLPKQYEPHREKIEKVLIPFEVKELDK